MKKSLIALGVIAAASAAQAQNVTVYGVMDAAYVSGKVGTVSTNGLASGGHSTSRLGFRGSEDLGGGMKVNWGLEAGMAIDTGAMGGPAGATGNQVGTVSGSFAVSASSQKIFNRGAFVGLSGGFGTINAGSISLAANGFTAAMLPGSGNFDAISMRAGIFASGNQFAVWRDNTIEYLSPTINGFTLALRHTVGNTTNNADVNSTGSEGSTATNKRYGQGNEIQLTYSMGKLNVNAYDSKVNLQTSGTAEMTAQGVGGTYDFGFMRAGLSHQKYDPSDTSATDHRKLMAIGAAIPVSAPLTLTVNYGDLKLGTGAGTKFSTLGAHYSLSKRSTAYAFWARADNNITGTSNMSGFAGGNSAFMATPTAGQDAESMGVGIRHSF